MNFKTTHRTLIFFILFLPVVALGQYTPLVGIPGVSDLNANMDAYINALYMLSIAVAALLAVIKIIIAGVKWMLTDIVTSKEEAKKDIENATIGLLIVMSAVLLLNIINPQLTNISVFVGKVDQVNTTNPPGSGQINATAGDTEQYMKNNPTNQAECESRPNGEVWHVVDSFDAYCIRREATAAPDRIVDTACIQKGQVRALDQNGLMVTSTEYNCDAARARCTEAKKTPSDKVLLSGAIDNKNIECN